MQSGEELDKDIATRLFKLVVVYDKNGQQALRVNDNKKVPLPKYSTDTDTAYNIIKYFKQRNFEFKLGYVIENTSVQWHAKLIKGRNSFESGPCSSLAHSVCVCAIKWLDKRKVSKTEPTKTPTNLVSIKFPKKDEEDT
jgi:hypothetical protein